MPYIKLRIEKMSLFLRGVGDKNNALPVKGFTMDVKNNLKILLFIRLFNLK